jgi:hypothetical protein
MSLYYKKLNYPKIPNYLLKYFVSAEKIVSDIGYGSHQELNPCHYTYGKLAYTPLLDWLQSNLKHIQITDVNIKTSNGESATHIVHSDVGRVAHLNYWWELGGDNVTTTWYQEKYKPLFRTKSIGGKQADDGYVDYKDLTVLDSTCFEKETWYLFCGSVLHDAKNITGRRRGLEISFNTLEDLNKTGMTLGVYGA